MVHSFKKHFVRFGPVTVTHPEITRYFMTIPGVSKPAIQAGALIERGGLKQQQMTGARKRDGINMVSRRG